MMPGQFGIPNGDMKGIGEDIMEDPGCQEDGDPFDDEKPVEVGGQEPIDLECSTGSSAFTVGDTFVEDPEEELGDPPKQNEISIGSDEDEDPIPLRLGDIDNDVDVTGDNEYPKTDVIENDGDIVLDGSIELTGVDISEAIEDDIDGEGCSDGEVWSGQVRRRGECDEMGEFESDQNKRQRMLDEVEEEDQWLGDECPQE